MIAFLDDGEGLLDVAELLASGAEPAPARFRSSFRSSFRASFRASFRSPFRTRALLAGYALLTAAGAILFAAQLPADLASPVSAAVTEPAPDAFRVRRDLPQPDRLTTPETGRRKASGRP